MNRERAALVPKLRFPEFESAGKWKICALSKLAIRINTRNHDNQITRVLTNSAIEGVIDQSDYFDREVANHKNLGNYFVIDEGDYVYNPRISATAPVGPVSKNKVGRGVMSPLYTVFRFENPNNAFYEQYFKTTLWHHYLKAISNTGARHDRMSISNDNFMEMPLPYHSEEEQQKIADCLSSLDDLIAAEGEKLEELRTHKKGLMQKLFPAEGKIVPEWRFPGFADAWEQRELGDHCDMFNGDRGIHYPNADDIVSEGIPFINAGDLQDGKVNLDSAKKINRAKYNQLGGAKIRLGDIVYCLRGTLGKNAYIDNFDEGTVASSLVVIRPNGIDGRYLFQVLNSNIEYRQRTICDEGAAQPNLSAKNLSGFKIPVPGKEEQKHISMFLSGIDDLIAEQTQKIESLKSHKRGLMQSLFPSIEEVGE